MLYALITFYNMKPTLHFSTPQPTLNKVLNICSRALDDNNVLPVNNYFLFEIDKSILTVSAFDMRTSITASCEIISDISFKICVPGAKMKQYISACDAQQVLMFEFIEHKSNKDGTTYSLTIKSKGGNCSMPCLPGEDFPNVNKIFSGDQFTFPAADFNEAMYKVLFAVSDDELRPSFTGVNVEIINKRVVFTATDTHVLATYGYDMGDGNLSGTPLPDTSLIIPKKSLQQIISLNPIGDMLISIGKTDVGIEFNNIKTSSRLIDGRYPDYRSVIPTGNDIVMSVPRVALLTSLARIMPFGNNITKMIIMSIGEDLKLTAENTDYAESAAETIPLISTGSIVICVDGAMLTGVLKSLSSDMVWFSFSTPNRAMLLLEEESGIGDRDDLVLLMPRQIVGGVV